MIPLDRVRELLSLAPGPHGGTLMDTSMVHDLARDVLSLADALATAERERDELHERDAFLTRERIAVATALDVPYATPLGEAVATRLARLTAERDADAEKVASLRQERDARDAALYSERGAQAEAEARLADLAAAVRAEREAESAVGIAGLCGRRESAVSAHNRAQRATDALLAAPAPTSVPAALVRAYLDAVDEWERERSAPVARTVARTAMIAARAALDAALAGCV